MSIYDINKSDKECQYSLKNHCSNSGDLIELACYKRVNISTMKKIVNNIFDSCKKFEPVKSWFEKYRYRESDIWSALFSNDFKLDVPKQVKLTPILSGEMKKFIQTVYSEKEMIELFSCVNSKIQHHKGSNFNFKQDDLITTKIFNLSCEYDKSTGKGSGRIGTKLVKTNNLFLALMRNNYFEAVDFLINLSTNKRSRVNALKELIFVATYHFGAILKYPEWCIGYMYSKINN